ncbi:hypothetical protein ACTQ5A_11265 [Bacillota bacterium LCP21S3_F9]
MTVVDKSSTSSGSTEQFNLTLGGTYWFDLSGENILGTVNTGNSSGAASVPDTTLHYVPFTYAGTVDAYKLISEMATTVDYATQNKYPHSLFVADYPVTHTVSWNELNNADLIFGRSYTGGSVDYTLRAPSCGSWYTGSDDSERGTPQSNEWDAVLDKNSGYIKNWGYMYSWGQDTVSNYLHCRAVRGFTPARHFYNNHATSRHEHAGFRPVLEVLNTDALGSDGLKAVTLDLNGGKLGGSTDNIQIIVKNGAAFTAPASDGLTRPDGDTGSFFIWKGSNGNLYAPGDSVPAGVTTLTAQWTPDTYTITYDGGDSEGSIPAGTKTHGVDYTLSSETFTREGYVQYGWQDKEGKFYKLGGVYSADADVTLYPVWDEMITVTAPFTTTVALGGNAEPDAKTFELMLIGSMGNELIFDDIKVTASVDTDGAGEYKGELTVTGPCRQLDKMLGEYAFVRQIDDGEENWTIDDTVWAVRFYQQEIAARSMSGVLYSLLIQPAYIKDTGDGLFYAVDINVEPLDEMSFTNVYTAHEHEYELKHDENGHWDECPCGDIQNEEAHIYGKWTVTKEATTDPTNPDTKPGTDTNPDTDTPATGDNSHMALWFALLFVSGAGVIGTTVYGKKKRAK